MYPSKVIFEQSKTIQADSAGDLFETCFNEVYSPKQTLEELVAVLESRIQSKVNNNPELYLTNEYLYGIKPRKILLKIEDITDQNLKSVIHSKGKCLNFNAIIEYEEVHLVGYMDNKYLITNTDIDLWNAYAEVIYIPNEAGLTIRKIQFIE